jgi:ATP-dependent protease ClpP protease subunit
VPDPTFAEISLEGDLAFDARYIPPDPTLPVVQLADVLRQMDEAQGAGRRAVLLVVDSYGGDAWAGFALYHALRELSEAGVHVVAYVKAIAGSTAALYVLGADYVVIDPAAAIHPHGSALQAPDNEVTRAVLETDGLLAGAVYAAHTFGRRDDVVRWVDQPGEEMRAARAVGVGFADLTGDIRAARDLADELAIGVEVVSRRRSTLAAIPRPPELVDTLEAAREIGAEVAACASGGRPLGPFFRAALARLHPGLADLDPRAAAGARRHLRLGASVVMLYAKIPTAAKQALGLFTTAGEVKRRHIVSGIRVFLRQGWSEVIEQSPEFKYFDQQIDRDVRELFRTMQGFAPIVAVANEEAGPVMRAVGEAVGGALTAAVEARRRIIRVAAAPMMLVQKSVNAVTWYAAREQALEEGHADPTAYADSVVRITQGGGGAKDLAAVQRGPEAWKLFTVFFGYRSVLYNRLTERLYGKDRWAKATELVARWWWAALLPVVFEQLLMNGIDDDEEPEDVVKRVSLEFALLPTSTIPGVGDLAEAVAEGRRMQYAPWLDTLARNALVVHELASGDDLEANDYKAVADLVGMTMRLPTSALWNLGDFTDRLLSGEFEEPVQDLLFRSPSKWE